MSNSPIPRQVSSVTALRAQIDEWRSSGARIGFVPTMGSLHEGHLSLIDAVKDHCDKSVVSIFVNPTQFAAHEDLDTYPRETQSDLQKLANRGCDLAYLPSAGEMYPEGFSTAISVGGVSEGLCGDSRPHFFGGVATVVSKLFNQCRPDVAAFGEKDYQQLLVVKRLVRDLDLNIKIIGVPTVREPDGLAMSSRNAYLSEADREKAGALNRTIKSIAAALEAGSTADDAVKDGIDALERAGVADIDYLEVRDAETLAPVQGQARSSSRVFIAAKIGETRLIDNWPART